MKIEQVRTGIYKADFRDCDGRRCRVTVNADNKKAALAEAKRLAKAGVEPVAQNVGGMTLKEALTRADIEFYSTTKSRSKSACVARQIEELFGSNTPIKVIDYEMIQDVINKWRVEGLAAGTINRKLSLLYKTLRLSLNWKHNGSPALLVMPTKPVKQRDGKKRTRIISPTEEATLSGMFEGEYLDLFHVLIDSGMRLGEVLGMQNAPLSMAIVNERALHEKFAYSEVNLEERKIHIWGNKGELPRTIPMTDRVFSVLSRLVGNQLVFSIRPDQITGKWNDARERMSIENGSGFSPHACRHTCATRLYDVTRDIYLVKEWLGHSNVSTTQRYTHIKSSQLDEAVGLLNGLSGKLPETVTTEAHTLQ